MAYKNFTGEDVTEDIGIVTSGIWQDGASSIATFFSECQYNCSNNACH